MEKQENRRMAYGMRVFTTIWFGQLISTLGSGLSGFALGVWIYDTTGSTTLFAISMLVFILPTILFAPFAGVIADRWNRRKVMLLADSLASLATIFIAVMIFSDSLQVWHIYVADVFYSIANTLQWPAYAAATSQLVPKKHLGRAGGMAQLGDAISSLAAPAIAGALYVTVGLGTILTIDIITYLFALGTLIAVRFPQTAKSEESAAGEGSFWKEATYGWHYLKERPGLLHLQITWFFINFCISVTAPLFVPLVMEITTPDILGYISSIISAGYLVGTLIMSIWGGPKRKIYGTYFAETAVGVSLFLTGLSPSLIFITAGQFLLALAMPITNGSTQAIWLNKVDHNVQGRVFSVRRMVAFSAIPLAYIVSGPLSEKVFGPMMLAGGKLAGSIGQIIGTGPGRGTGLMYVIFGLVYICIAQVVRLDKRIWRMELELPDAVQEDEEEISAAAEMEIAASPAG